MSGLNLQNFIGNMYLPTIDNQFLKKKVGKNKFSILKIASSPLISGDNIIFGDDTGTIFNINKNGKIKWKKNVYKKVYKKIYKNLTFFIYKNKIYISDNIGFIYSIDLYNGKLIWIKNHGIPLKSKIKVFGDKIFIINQDNRLLCLDLKDGSIIWDLRSISTFIKSQHLLGLTISKEGEIIILTSSSDLIKIDSNSGGIYWSLNITGTTSPSATDFFKSSDIVINNNDVIFSTSSSIFSFNLNTGYLNWSKNIYSTNTPIIDGNYIFSVTNNGYFVNIDRKSGDIIWSTNILKILKKKKRKTLVTGFILGSDKIYATTLNGFIIVCSANSGKIEYIKKIGDSIISPPIISNGSLYILTEESRIIGFN
jgi:outer membrane protein assembly factor BamB